MRVLIIIVLLIVIVHDSYLAKYTVYTNNVMMAGYDHVMTAERVDTFGECMQLVKRYDRADRLDSYVLKPKGGRTFSCYRETWIN